MYEMQSHIFNYTMVEEGLAIYKSRDNISRKNKKVNREFL